VAGWMAKVSAGFTTAALLQFIAVLCVKIVGWL